MSPERLAHPLQARRAAMDADPAHEITHGAILSVFSALEQGDVTEGQALRVLALQAARLADERDVAALSRQAAADIRQMRREEH